MSLDPAPRRLSTRGQLSVAFAAIVAAIVTALGVQALALHRMEATFAEMQESRQLLALQGAALRWTATLLLAVPMLGALALVHLSKVIESEQAAGERRIAAGIAHVINNPLQVMLGYLSLHRDYPDRRLARELALVEEETLRCKRAVEGVFKLTGPTALAVAPVDVGALCEELSAELGTPDARGEVRVSVAGAGEAVADPCKLREALLDLMRNAVEAAAPAGDVAVRIGGTDAVVEIAVSDSGPGVAPAAQPHLFEPFFTTKPNGTGLGLALARAIARAHGGDVEAQMPKAGGAVFTLRLPRSV